MTCLEEQFYDEIKNKCVSYSSLCGVDQYYEKMTKLCKDNSLLCKIN